jgi:hypothetical protein
VMLWRERRIKDTPCARCGHTHFGWSPVEYGWPMRCGEWLFWFERYEDGTPKDAFYAPCDCPDWIAPPKSERCYCGQIGRKMDTYLNGIRACSPACAYEGERRERVA